MTRILDPTREDCMKCYRQYQKEKIFNKDCVVYEENKHNPDYKLKCVWITIIEKDLEALAKAKL